MPTHYCYCNCNVQEYNQPLLAQKPCGAVTEEGKRTCPFADRPIQEALRLPSSVTLPPTLEINKTAFISNRLNAGQHHHRQCATFSSGEGFRIVKRFSHCEIFHKIATSAATVGQPQGLSLRSTYDRSTHHYKSGASATRLDQWGA